MADTNSPMPRAVIPAKVRRNRPRRKAVAALEDENASLDYKSPGLLRYFVSDRGKLLPRSGLRQKRLLHAFRLARPWHYGAFFVLRSPALLSAVVVYTIALGLFGVEASLVSMLGYLPVIFFAATVPTPMRAAAITSWVILFPGNEGQVAAFGFVQHNFFILFNATIGLLFLRRAQRDLFGR